MEALKKLVGEEVFKEHILPKLEKDAKYFFGVGEFIPKGRFDENNTSLKNLLAERDNQLKDLQKQAKGHEELAKSLEDLQKLNEEQKNAYEKKLADQEYDFAFSNMLNKTNAKDPKLLASLINKEELKFDNGKFIGFDEQLEKIKKSHEYLFEDVKTNPVRSGNQFGLNPQQKTEPSQQVSKTPWSRKSPFK